MAQQSRTRSHQLTLLEHSLLLCFGYLKIYALHDIIFFNRTRHGRFGINKNGFQHWGLCVPRDSDDNVNIATVSLM